MMEGSWFWRRVEDNDFKQWIPPPVNSSLNNNGFIANKQTGMSQKCFPVPVFKKCSEFKNVTVAPETKVAIDLWSQNVIYGRGYPELSRIAEGLPSPVKPFIAQDNHNSTQSPVSYKICNFCRQNGDRREFYSGHQLKNEFGKVECPVLREHVCELCGATGENAHTRSYCRRFKNGQMSKSAAYLKKTLHDSCGRIRR